MSLLQAIKEAEALVASLKALLGGGQVGPWYENIPEKGVECWVADERATVIAEKDEADDDDTRVVYRYDSSEQMQFIALMHNSRFDPDNMVGWKYAIPVDPNLRLPDGKITL